jgi:membrane protein
VSSDGYSESGQADGGEQSQIAAPEAAPPEEQVPVRSRSRLRILRDRETATVARVEAVEEAAVARVEAVEAAAIAHVEASVAGRYWSRLTAVDFMNSSLAFAALAVVCGFPFLAVVSAATDRDVREIIIARMGLSAKAAEDVSSLISSPHRAVATLTVLGAVVLVLGAVGMASTLQTWYQRIYDQPPPKGALRPLAVHAVWVAAFSIYIAVEILVLKQARPGGRALVYVVEFGFAVLFWWWSAYLLLLGRVPWRQLFSLGVATGFCIAGLAVFSSLFFSGSIISSEKSYGAAGVVLVLMSYLIGFGVCLHLGAVCGRMWNDWRLARRLSPNSAQEDSQPA